MGFYKLISTILHPIVIPTIGVMLYFLLIPNTLLQNQKLTILSLVFGVSYIIPLLILILLKKTRIIKNYQPKSIEERKLPIALMTIILYLFGNSLSSIANLIDLGLLFHATSLGLFLIYMLFYFKIKASIHLLSFGISVGFFMVLSIDYAQSFTIVIMTIILLAGLLASARLHLKSHTPKEIYVGFFIGTVTPFFLQYLL
jgi:membrane-associated HD superfamily phosphohydrolase